jgi:phosphoketolase
MIPRVGSHRALVLAPRHLHPKECPPPGLRNAASDVAQRWATWQIRSKTSRVTIDRASSLSSCVTYLTQSLRDKLLDHRQNNGKCDDDIPQIRDWKWSL